MKISDYTRSWMIFFSSIELFNMMFKLTQKKACTSYKIVIRKKMLLLLISSEQYTYMTMQILVQSLIKKCVSTNSNDCAAMIDWRIYYKSNEIC